MSEIVETAGPVVALFGLLGLAVGFFNRWLVAAPMRRLRAVSDPASPEARQLMREVGFRFLLRMVSSLALLFVVFLVNREPLALIAATVGLILPNAVSVAAAVRARRTS